MKKPEQLPVIAEEGFEVKFHPRPTTQVAITIPDETLTSLDKVAVNRDMSREALIKLYIGHGLRQDTARLFADQVLERTAKVLTRHLQSEQEVSEILKEIREEALTTD